MENKEHFNDEIEAIKERNRRVEADKAWETSWTRRFFITTVTYAAAVIWLLLIDDSRPFLKAFVPAAAYALSTLSLNAIKRAWLKRVRK